MLKRLLTWNAKIQIARVANLGDLRRFGATNDGLLEPTLTISLDGKGTAANMLIGELDIDKINARLLGSVGDPTVRVIPILAVDVDL